MSSLVTRSAVLALVLTVSARADVWVVGPQVGPGVDFVEVQAAVAAAADGDLVLIRPGTYSSGVSIDAKRVSLLADIADDAAPRPVIHALEPLRIANLAAAQDVFVRGLELRALADQTANQSFPGLAVDGSSGAVLIENCALFGADAAPGLGALPAARVEDCSGGVEFVRSTLAGGIGFGFAPGFWGPTEGGAGLSVANARVVLHGARLEGGEGGFGSFDPGCIFVGCARGMPGGAAARGLFGVQLVVYGSELLGGNSGAGWFEGVDGVDALEGDPSMNLRVKDSLLIGGAGGVGDLSTGAAGVAFDALLAPVVIPGVARSISIECPRRVGESATLRLRGSLGDVGAVYGGPGWHSRALLDSSLALFLDAPIYYGGVSTLIGAVEVELRVSMPTVGSDEARTSMCQGLFLDLLSNSMDFGAPSVAVVLAPGL